MSTITLEKVHALLEKLAEYVMNELPTRKEMDAKMALKADKKDLEELRFEMREKFDLLLGGMDAQARELVDMRNEFKAVSRTLDIHEQRLGDLEQRTLGYRVRDEEK